MTCPDCSALMDEADAAHKARARAESTRERRAADAACADVEARWRDHLGSDLHRGRS